MSTNIKDLLRRAIEKTENPMAPFILQEAHSSLDRLAKLLVPQASKDMAEELTDLMLDSLGSKDIQDVISHSPSFIVALAGMLSVSIEDYARAPDPHDSKPCSHPKHNKNRICPGCGGRRA